MNSSRSASRLVLAKANTSSVSMNVSRVFLRAICRYLTKSSKLPEHNSHVSFNNNFIIRLYNFWNAKNNSLVIYLIDTPNWPTWGIIHTDRYSPLALAASMTSVNVEGSSALMYESIASFTISSSNWALANRLHTADSLHRSANSYALSKLRMWPIKTCKISGQRS